MKNASILMFANVLLLAIQALNAELVTYDYPDVIVPLTDVLDKDKAYKVETTRSRIFRVQVEQEGLGREAYVMFTPNPYKSGNLAATPNTHWTNFSFDGKVKLKISLNSEPVTSCEIFPVRKGYSAEIREGVAEFEIDSSSGQIPLQLYLRINQLDMEPLFIFADPLETDVPNRTDRENVELISVSDDIESVRKKLLSPRKYVVFEEGVHSWGEDKTRDYEGYKLPYISNKNIYIPGGAYVIGTFEGVTADNSKIYGRGVISTCGKNRIDGTPGIPYSMVYQSGDSENQVIEGVITTDPPHFHLTYRGQVVIDNVKMIGYWHQTDGTVTGRNSVVKNSFIKTNDDYIKLYSDHCYHVNNTLFHQVNGAPFQFCWGSQNADNNIIRDTYIIFSSYNSGDGPNVKLNTAVINSRHGSGQVTENHLWDGLYIDNGCHRLIGLNGENKPGTVFRNIRIKNVVINSGMAPRPQDGASYLTGSNAGIFDGIVIENLVIDGKKIRGTSEDRDGDGKLWVKENGDQIQFE